MRSSIVTPAKAGVQTCLDPGFRRGDVRHYAMAILLLAAAPFLAAAKAPIKKKPAAKDPVVGGLVHSKEWVVHRGKDEQEEFIGDVRYHSAEDSGSSDWALYKHGPQTWNAKGHVIASRTVKSGDIVEAAGDEAFFDQITKKGNLTAANPVHLKRTPVDGEPPDLAVADRLEWQAKEKASLIGHVHSWGPRLETWSDRADYDGNDSQVLLTGGRPVARKMSGEWIGAVKADEIHAIDNPRRMLADGKAIGWIEFYKKDTDKNMKKKAAPGSKKNETSR